MNPIRHPLRRVLPVLVVLSLSACGGSEAPAPGQQPASDRPEPAAAAPAQPSNLPTITGQASAGEISQLPRGIALRVRLLDVTDPATPPVTVAETSTETRRLPIDFALPYEPAKIAGDRAYIVQAELVTEGVTLYSTQNPTPVLTRGAGQRADLVLVRGAGQDTSISVSEQFRRDFDLLESQLGNLRRITGERMTDDVTVGWDAFVDDTGVRFARESVDFAEGGRASFRYAYRYGKPWIVAREQGGAVSFVGWDEDGNVVLNQRGDGKVGDGDVATLRARAADMLQIASSRAGAAR